MGFRSYESARQFRRFGVWPILCRRPLVSYYEAWSVEVDGDANQHSAGFEDFETALEYFLRERAYDVRIKLIFTGGEYEEE